jgi:hypothetical protein
MTALFVAVYENLMFVVIMDILRLVFGLFLLVAVIYYLVNVFAVVGTYHVSIATRPCNYANVLCKSCEQSSCYFCQSRLIGLVHLFAFSTSEI